MHRGHAVPHLYNSDLRGWLNLRQNRYLISYLRYYLQASLTLECVPAFNGPLIITEYRLLKFQS